MWKQERRAKRVKIMFNQFESSDEHERKAKAEARFNMLKLAYENGYFNEEGSESVALCGSHDLADEAVGAGEIDDDALILVFDGDRPDDDFDLAEHQYRRGVYHAGSEDCPTCSRPRVMFVDGDCPECNPPINAAGERRCGVCRGVGVLFNGTGCQWCLGTGSEPTA